MEKLGSDVIEEMGRKDVAGVIQVCVCLHVST